MISAAHSDNTLGLYLIRDDAWVEPVEDYKIIGSGSNLGNFMMNQQNRFFESDNMKLSGAEFDYAIFIACYIINEIKNFDTKTGGSVNIAVIYQGEYHEVPEKQVSEFYANGVETISTGMGPMAN
ncbi:MAG: hypothetical protein M3044_21035, partial [Thermoproteota archaeon]|nr:hypothetical protein [Thermoproteota archaeon]